MKDLPGLAPGETCSTLCSRDRHDVDRHRMPIVRPLPDSPCRWVVRFLENSFVLRGTPRLDRWGWLTRRTTEAIRSGNATDK